jgi:electron transfer flavoprotein beta subunit
VSVVVAYKWAASPNDASIAPDGSADWSRAKAAISEYDPVAIQVARDFADAAQAELIGISIGAPDVAGSLAKKAALSRGLDKAVLVADESLAGAGATLTGKVIAAAVNQIGGVELVITGDSSVDIGAHLVSATIAGALGWPVIPDALAVAGKPGELEVTQVTASGTRTLRVTGPAVVAVTADAAQPKIPGMKEILGAGKKPSEELPLAGLGVVVPTGVDTQASSRVEPPPRAKQLITAGDPTEAAAELAAWLRANV